MIGLNYWSGMCNKEEKDVKDSYKIFSTGNWSDDKQYREEGEATEWGRWYSIWGDEYEYEVLAASTQGNGVYATGVSHNWSSESQLYMHNIKYNR